MQFSAALSALALLSTSVLAAAPQLIEKDSDSKWSLPWAEKRSYRYAYPPAYSYSPLPIHLKTGSSAVSQTGASFPTGTGLPSGTGILGTGTAYSSTSSATSSDAFTCPNVTASVRYITVIASITSTTFVPFIGTGGSSGLPSSSANSTGIYTLSPWNATTLDSGSSGYATGKHPKPLRHSTSTVYVNITTTLSDSVASSTTSPFNETTSSALNTTSSVLLNTTSSTVMVTNTAYTNTSSFLPTSTPCNNASAILNTTASTAVITSALPTSTPCSKSTLAANSTSFTTVVASSVYSNSSSTSSIVLSTSSVSINTSSSSAPTLAAYLNLSPSTESTTSITSTTTLVYSTVSVNTSTTLTRTSTHSIETFSFSTTTFTVTTAATPVTINTGTDLHPITSYTPTTVVTAQATGTPNPKALHCGLHGLPVGDYFLAEFVEEKADVAVTLEGCYEFCEGVYGIDMGCESYSFYPEEGTGAPRCDLYGGSVAQSLDSINNYVPNVWYDLGCGDPLLI